MEGFFGRDSGNATGPSASRNRASLAFMCFFLSRIGTLAHNPSVLGAFSVQQAGAFEAESGEPRARVARLSHASALGNASTITVSQLLWTRALPGTVAMLAALSLPELSLGAGAPVDAPAALGRAQAQAQAQAPALAAARPAASAPKLAPPRAEPVPAGLREPLAPATEVFASEPVVAVAEPALLVPDTRPEPQTGLAAARAPEIAPPALVTAPAPPVAALVLAVPAALPLAEPEPAVMAPAEAPEAVLAKAPKVEAQEAAAVVAASASAPGAFGGTKGSFGGLAPSAAAAPEAALTGNNIVSAKASAPAGLGDATPGRRPALAPLAPPTASAPVAAPAAVAPVPAPSAPAPRLAPAGLSEPVAVVPPAPPQAAALVAAAPIAAAAPARPAAPLAVAAPVRPKAPTLAAAPAQVAPRPKPAAPVAAALAPARAAAAPVPVKAKTAAAPAPASAPAPAAALAPLPQVKPQQPAPGVGKPSAYAIDVKSQLTTRVDGKMAGKVDFRQTASGLQVRLGSIVELLGDRYEPAQIERIMASSASELYLPLAQLQAQGIPISYDPVYDEFNVGLVDTRPKAARKVHMDQISAPERGLGSTGIDQLPRR